MYVLVVSEKKAENEKLAQANYIFSAQANLGSIKLIMDAFFLLQGSCCKTFGRFWSLLAKSGENNWI